MNWNDAVVLCNFLNKVNVKYVISKCRCGSYDVLYEEDVKPYHNIVFKDGKKVGS